VGTEKKKKTTTKLTDTTELIIIIITTIEDKEIRKETTGVESLTLTKTTAPTDKIIMSDRYKLYRKTNRSPKDKQKIHN